MGEDDVADDAHGGLDPPKTVTSTACVDRTHVPVGKLSQHDVFVITYSDDWGVVMEEQMRQLHGLHRTIQDFTVTDTDGFVVDIACSADLALQPPPVPLQRWEAEKLKAVATQVVVALASGCYKEDFGRILLDQFQSWPGVEAWAGAEGSRIAVLVADAQNDPRKKDELQQWVEVTLLSTLCEIEKEVNRGQMAGLELECRGSVPSRQVPLTTPQQGQTNSSTTSSKESEAAGSCLQRSDSNNSWLLLDA